MDYYWPQDIIPGEQEWKIADSVGVFQSPLNGAIRTVSRPGTRIGCSMMIPNLNASKRHRLMALLAALKGRGNRIWLQDFGTVQRGSFPAVELLSNTTFPNTTGWASSNAELVLTADSGRMRLTRTAVAADRYASMLGTSVSGSAYLFRAGVIAGRGAMGYRLQLGTTATASDLVAGSNLTASGYQQVSAIATGTSTYAILQDKISGRSADFFQFLDSPSLARCALVNGASQTGSGLLIDQLPASTNGIAVAGDMVAVYTTQWEMKRLIADLNSNSSGAGYLMFEPGLRASPADNAPIAFVTPMARFMLASDETSWSTKAGLFSDFQLDFVEDIT
jgi:hypothetical protein